MELIRNPLLARCFQFTESAGSNGVQKRINQIGELYPDLLQKQTVTYTDTVHVKFNKTVNDTVKVFDTVHIDGILIQ